MNKRNIIFFSLSIALHLGAIILLFETTDNEVKIHPNSEQGRLPLSISFLKEQSHPIQKPEKKPTKNSVRADIKLKKVSALVTSKTPPSDPAPLETTPPSNTIDLSISNTKNAHSKSPDHVIINQILREELSRHFYYPAVAQRRNWQGEVLIEFTVTSNGDITQIHISTSSGYPILDNAAIGALSKINTGDRFLLALNGHSIEKTLPVIYALASR